MSATRSMHQEPGANQEECPTCGGEGGFHDCGEDCCPCLYHNGEPEDFDWFDCSECGGSGYLNARPNRG